MANLDPFQFTITAEADSAVWRILQSCRCVCLGQMAHADQSVIWIEGSIIPTSIYSQHRQVRYGNALLKYILQAPRVTASIIFTFQIKKTLAFSDE